MENKYYSQVCKVEDGVLVKAFPDSNGNFVIPKNVKILDLENETDFLPNLKSISFEEGSILSSFPTYYFTLAINLKSADLSNADKLTKINDGLFSSCYNLESIKFPKNISSIGVRSFEECYSLKNLDLSNLENLRTLNEACFLACNSVENILLPSSLEIIGEEVFSSCASLKNINLSSLTNLYEIKDECFKSCINLKNIILPKDLAYLGDSTFYNCSSLENINLHDCKVLNNLPAHLFQRCSSLEKIIIPKNIKYVDSYVFEECNKLKNVITDINFKPINIEYSSFLNPNLNKKVNKYIDSTVFDTSFFVCNSNEDFKTFFKLLNNELNYEQVKGGYSKDFYFKFNFDTLDEIGFARLLKTIDIVKAKNLPVKFIAYRDKENLKINDDKICYIYSKDEFLKLDKINNYLKENLDSELLYQEISENHFIVENENCFTHSQVKKANNEIQNIVNKIKEANLSPFEAMIYVHDYCSKFDYKNSKSDINESSRNIVEILNNKNPNIVCVGYASLEKAIIDELDMPGLKCKLNVCEFLKKDNLVNIDSAHVNNIVEIIDDKYNIKGKYFDDSCWDFKRNNKYQTFMTLLYSVKDLNSFKNLDYYAFDIDNKELISGVRRNLYLETGLNYKFKENEINDEENLIKEKNMILNFLSKFNSNSEIEILNKLNDKLKEINSNFEELPKVDKLKKNILQKTIKYIKENPYINITNRELLHSMIEDNIKNSKIKRNNFNKAIIKKSLDVRNAQNVTDRQVKFYTEAQSKEITFDMIKEGYEAVVNKMNLNISKDDIENRFKLTKELANVLYDKNSSRNTSLLNQDIFLETFAADIELNNIEENEDFLL